MTRPPVELDSVTSPDPCTAHEIDQLIEPIGRGPESVIPILRAIQGACNYLPEAALRRVCETTDITPAAIAGVSTFYTHFRHQPAGQHTIRVCVGTACHVKGAEQVYNAIGRQLGLADGSDTDEDRLFTVQKVACLGCCTLAPVVQIDSVTYGHMTPDGIGSMLKDFLSRPQGEGPDSDAGAGPHGESEGQVRIGLGSCCIASGSAELRDAVESSLAGTGASVEVKRVGCVGMCHRTPLLEVVPKGGEPILYSRVDTEDVRRIMHTHFPAKHPMARVREAANRMLERLLTDKTWDPVTRYAVDVREEPVSAYLDRQKHIATEACGVMDPTDMNEYRELGGFNAFEACLSGNAPNRIIQTILASGLRGRGGAGFPAGRKWDLVRRAEGDLKYMICNGDEGDPGAFMDRMILESYPYRVIEGMLIAAFAVGASHGYLYIRAEYPLAVRRVDEALLRCREAGLLGDNILGSAFSFDLRIMEGAGAFVCGEETAMIASIQGGRGMPRLRPPYPADSGLWGRPTLINNCETLAVVPWIMRHGPEAFAALGTETSKGTKVFSLAGKIARGGLIEVPMGMSLREIVEGIGGGMAGGREFKAVQIGGPSGGCVPAARADIPVDYEALIEVGAMMGSGGFVVMDDRDCMVDIARYFLSFTQDQSCGKCTFCRIGTKRMLEILERLCSGDGRQGDIERLEELAAAVKEGSLCQLGGTAPNPVLTTMKYFRDEYEAHIAGRCPAHKCTALIRYRINDNCIGCTRCAQHCPVDAIAMTPYEKHEIDDELCTRCDTCRQVCPSDAVEMVDRDAAHGAATTEE